MNTPTKLGGYALGLVAVLGAAAGIGSAVGPLGGSTQDTASHTASHDIPAHTQSHPESPMDTTAQPASAAHLPGGLQISQDGYTLDAPDSLPAGAATPVSFRILGPD